MSNLLLNQVFILFTIIILGESLGRLRVKSFSFGSAAIIFVAMAFGHFGYVLPSEFQTLGLALFIYAIAVSAGPGFFSSFKRQGLTLSLGAVLIITAAALTTLMCCWLFGFDVPTGTGLFAGALSSSPGLAVAVESAGDGAAAAYGVTYVGGIISVIIVMKLLPLVLGIDIEEQERELDRERTENNPPFTFRHIEVTNSNLYGKKVCDLKLKEIAPVVLTRLLRKGAEEPLLVEGDTEICEGDKLRIAGRTADIERVGMFLGKEVEGEIAFTRFLVRKSIVVSRESATGITLGLLNLRETFGVQVTRIERNGIDFPPSGTTKLHMGDVIIVVGEEDALQNVIKIVGNDIEQVHQVSLLPVLVGLVLGFILGELPLYLPGVGDFSFGSTGGVLISGLILGYMYKTGPFVWQMPESGNSFLKELGLMFFLAAVGTKTGAIMVDTVATIGMELVLAGLMVTILPMVCYVLVARYLQKIPFLQMLGVLTGGMTSTPGLAAVNSYTNSLYATSAYATVYPVGLIGMIFITKGLVYLLEYIG